MRTLLAALLLSLPGTVAAQSKHWPGISEDDLHASPTTPSGPLEGVLASCDKTGTMRLSAKYAKDYDLTSRDLAAVDRLFLAAKRFEDIGAALAAGYLPNPGGWDPGFGLPLLHPQLVIDGGYDLDRPDALSYVKVKGQEKYRLVGMAFIAGKEEPPQRTDVDFDEKSRKKGSKASAETWDYEEQVCIIHKPGRFLATFYGKEIPDRCAGGIFLKRIWRLYAWPLVYNPEGLFHERNPLVDRLDRSQKFGPLCPAPKR